MPTYRRVNNQSFVNPYNFVKLGNHCVRNINYESAKDAPDAKSGWLDCELELKSPIFIPNTSNDKYFGQWHPEQDGNLKSYEFYSYENLENTSGNPENTPPPAKPVIPGSEIRGMIRSAFEALTDSCLSTIDPQMSFHKRAPRSRQSGRPGILRRNGANWEFVPCTRYMLKTYTCGSDPFSYPAGYAGWDDWRKHITALERSSSPVWIYPGLPFKKRPYMDCMIKQFEEVATPGLLQGYAHVTAHFMSKKHHDSVFVIQGAAAISVSREEAENYLENLRLCLEHDTFGPEYAHLNRGNSIDDYDNICVYYVEYKGRKYFSPSMINREMLYNKLGDRIGDFQPCDDSEHLCSACSLFGMVSDRGSVSSRLRFSDAFPVPGSTEFSTPVLLEELAGPKPSAAEFYLERPANQHNWNYDYQMTWGNGNTITADAYTGRIRGRKFYWHHNSVQTSNLLTTNNLNDEQKKKLLRMCLVRPLNQGIFKFRVYFDRISNANLLKLVYIITIGFSTEHAHKLGMGKPLGLGSVQIRASLTQQRMFTPDCVRMMKPFDYSDKVNSTKIIKYCEGALGFNGILDQFKALTRLGAYNNISYPYVGDGYGNRLPQSFKWFVGNKQIQGVGSANKPIIDQDLPNPENPELKEIQEIP